MVAKQVPVAVHWGGFDGQWRPDHTRAEVWAGSRPGEVYLFEIEVAVLWRGRGLGTALLAEVCRAADGAGVALTLLPASLTREGERRLRAWYRRHGFVDESRSGRWGLGMRREPGRR